MKEELRYDMDTADETAVMNHFACCGKEFIRMLDSRVGRAEYARKLALKSTRFEAWCGGSLVGLVAAYFGPEPAHLVHITNVSVSSQYSGKGIATILLGRCLDTAGEQGAGRITLEVAITNKRAASLYERFGFRETGRDGQFLLMERIPAGKNPPD